MWRGRDVKLYILYSFCIVGVNLIYRLISFAGAGWRCASVSVCFLVVGDPDLAGWEGRWLRHLGFSHIFWEM